MIYIWVNPKIPVISGCIYPFNFLIIGISLALIIDEWPNESWHELNSVVLPFAEDQTNLVSRYWHYN